MWSTPVVLQRWRDAREKAGPKRPTQHCRVEISGPYGKGTTSSTSKEMKRLWEHAEVAEE